MYIDIVPNRKSSPAILLRESYRSGGKIKKRTLANLSALSLEQAHKLRAVLKGGELSGGKLEDAFEILKSTPHGHVAAVLGTIKRLKLPALLGRSDSPERRCAVALIAGRILSPGSKLSLSRHLGGSASTLAAELQLDPELSEDDLYAAMRWLGQRQERIQKRLAAQRLTEGSVILYDLSSSYYEGSQCELAQRGYNRDGKKGKTQINYGVLTDAQGCPVAVEVYPGNTSDPATVADQLLKLRKSFGLKKITVVGDRGMLTSKQLELAAEDPSLDDYGWISALRSDQVKGLLADGSLQPELFDQRDLAEIRSDDFPGERLVVCRNPELAVKRTRTREDLLAATQAALQKIADATARAKNPYKGKDSIARRVEREAAKYKMLKHYRLDIGESSLEYVLDEASVAREARLDGFYVVRARNVPSQEMDESEIVSTYKSLSGVERVFRSLKTTSLKVRPIFHRESDMVRAHIFVCLLAQYVQWTMEQGLRELLFADGELEAQKAARPTPVEPTQRSDSAKAKISSKRSVDGFALHSFRSLLENLAGLCRSQCQAQLPGAPSFEKLSQPTELHRRVFELLNVPIPKM